MKKYISRLLIVILTISFIVIPKATPTYASAPLPAYESSIQVQNLDTVNSANIFIYYYNPDGSLAVLPDPYTNPVSDTVPAGSSNTYLPIHPDAGFTGSAVIQSDREVALITNLVIAATNRALGTYTGVSSGGSSLFFPLIDKRKNVSVFSIQNAGSGTANYSIDFIPLPGSSYADISNVNGSLSEGAAKIYNMADYNGTSDWLGSIKVSASLGSITGVVSNVNNTLPTSPRNAVYNGFNAGSIEVNLPLIMEANNGNRTGTSCQNLGPNPATITMSYTPSSGFAPRADDVFTNVPVNGIAVKLMNEFGERWIGGSTVTVDNSSNIVCVVNQSRPIRMNSNLYEGFKPTAATDEVVLPLIMSKNGNITQTFTAFSVASADGTSISVTCDWRPSPGFADIANTTKSGAPVLLFNQQTGFSPSDTRWIGSAVCTETTGKGIFAIVNQSRESLPADYLRDVTSSYDGFNQ